MGRKAAETGVADAAEKRRIVAVALAAGATQVAAGKAAGVADRTVRAWLQEPTFVDMLREERARLIDAGAGRLAALVDHAADALENVLKDSGSDAARVSAARVVFESLLKIRDQSEFAEKLRELQRLAGIRSPSLNSND